MKFQKLTIHNIASIEDAVIDFEAQPLADSEVFLITGKTGAGKSTILDAICLALYADTPRLDSTRMQGDTKDGEKTVKIDDPRQLMRRNTGEAFVSLTFTGSNEVHYEAVWSVARARKKVTGNMQQKDWQLKNLDTDHTLTKDKEIEAEIHAAIGLDFNQFCRTTMLAQGEFTRFLNSKDDEKAEILEKITGVDVYSKIGAKVFEVTAQKKQLWDDAQRLVVGTHTLTDAEIGEKKAAMAELEKQNNGQKEASNKDITKRDWIKADDEFSQAITVNTAKLQKANEVIESPKFTEQESLIKDWNTTIDARQWKGEKDKAEKELESQKKVLEGLTEEYSRLLAGQKAEEQEIESLATEKGEIEAFLEGESDKAAIYENAQTIVGHLTTIAEGRDAITEKNSEIEKERISLDEILTPALNKAKADAAVAKEQYEMEEAEVKQQEEEVTTLNLSDLRTQREQKNNLLANITKAKERLDILANARVQHENVRNRLATQLSDIETKKKKSAEMDAPIHDAKLKMTERKDALERQRDTIEKFSKTLRLKLKVGDTCPVCRQKIEAEIPHEEDIALLVSGLQEAYNIAEKDHKDLVESKTKIDAEIKTESKVYEREIKAFNEDSSVAQAEQRAKDACKECGIIELGSSTLPLLDALENSTKAEMTEIADKISIGEKKETAVKELRKQLDSKRKAAEASAANVVQAEQAVANSNSRISTAEALVKTKADDVEKATQKVKQLMSSTTWDNDWNTAPKDFGTSLTAMAKEFTAKSQKKQKLSAALDTANGNYRNVATVMESILEAMPEWKALSATIATKVDNLLDKANDVDNMVTVALTKLKTAEVCYHTNKKQLDDFLAINEAMTVERLAMLDEYTSKQITDIDAVLKKDRDAVIAAKTLLDNAKKQQEVHQQKKPELTEDDTMEEILLRIEEYEKIIKELNEQIGAINQELKIDAENKARLGALMEDADMKKADYQKWSRMNQLIGDATGKKFRMIAQSYVLTSLIHSANSYMKTLTDRYTLKVTPGTFVITLEDAYQGFVSRAASTISGGESFLVSLSLALALSDIGQTLSVDTLFIDEGFGTLSGEPLQNAINTLRSLHTKAGRHVGIISHVEELQERIPVQIQVNQEGNNSSSKVKIVPEIITFS